jgi:hypothetical protein
MYIDNDDLYEHEEDCEMLHDDDFLICENNRSCDFEGVEGKKFSKMVQKYKGIRLEKCTCCNGNGWIEVNNEAQ